MTRLVQATPPRTHSWGYLPTLAVSAAAALLLIALADTGARQSAGWATTLFWAGIIILYFPIVARLCTQTPIRHERIGLLALLTLAVYLIKVLHSPIDFTFTDEFQHYRTLSDILMTNHLYTPNPLSLVSPNYPGLEVVVHALMSVTGLPIFESALVVVGVARLIMILALFLLYEQITHSARFASVAAALYMANFNYVFWSAQFAYESLSLPLAVFIIYLLAARQRTTGTIRWMLVILCSVVAVLATHHLTMYWLLTVLVAWAICTRLVHVLNRPRISAQPTQILTIRAGEYKRLAVIALLIVVFIAGWLTFQAPQTILYLTYPLRDGASDVVKAASGDSGTNRPLFQDFSGLVAPVWERLAGLASVMLALVGLLIGLWLVWKLRRNQPLALVFMLGALFYPLVLPLRLLPRGWEISNRTSEFVFVALAFILAHSLLYLSQLLHRYPRLSAGIGGGLATLLLMGGLISGWPYWARLPGSYLPSAESRSIEQKGLSAAYWTRDYLGPQRPILTDRINGMLMGAYGEQYIVSYATTQLYVAPLLLEPDFADWHLRNLKQSQTQFVAMDKRLTTNLPVIGYYVEVGEPGGLQHREPVSLEAALKFDRVPSISRIFDDGDIVIYDIRKFNGVP